MRDKHQGQAAQYAIVSEAQLDQIHNATLQVMERTGVRFLHEAATDIFREHGFSADANNIVRFKPQQVEAAIRSAPSRFTRIGLDPDCRVEYGTCGRHFGVGSLPIYIHDTTSRQRRRVTREDMRNISFLGSELENFDISNASVQDLEIPEDIIHVAWLQEQYTTSRKPFCCWYAKDVQTARDTLALAEAAQGGIDEVRRCQTIAITATIDNALTWGRSIIGLMEFASQGLCVEIMPMPMAGSCNPVTLAGTLVQGNAEILAAVALSQLINPGTPVIYAPYCGMMDMAAATHSFGAAEVGMMASAWSQLSRRYGIPNDMVVATSDSKCPDAQAAYEKTISMLLPALAGADSLSMCGGMIDFALQASYEQLVIDNEIIGNIKRIISGIEVDEATLATDLIDRIAHGGSFLAEEHTLKYFRQEQYLSELRDRSDYEKWCADGRKDILTRAGEKVQEILKRPRKCHLSPEGKDAMDAVAAGIVERTQR